MSPAAIELLTILALVSSLGIWSARSATRLRRTQEDIRRDHAEPAKRRNSSELNESNPKAMEMAAGILKTSVSSKESQFPHARVER